MKTLTKLKSLNMWVDEDGVYSPNDDGTPNINDVKLYSDINPDWFQNLSSEDKEQISIIIKNKNNKD
jgi:hypothetical protein